MATLEERIALSRRRGSEVSITSNPLEQGSGSSSAVVRVQNISNAKLIEKEQLNELIKKLEAASDNHEIIAIIEVEKEPYLFQSTDLLKIVNDVTPSVKTRIAIIQLLGPRLTDPKTSMTKFTDLFRFSEDKSQVEEVIKARIQAMINTHFKASESQGLARPRSGRGFVMAGRSQRKTEPITVLPSIESRHNSVVEKEVDEEVVVRLRNLETNDTEEEKTTATVIAAPVTIDENKNTSTDDVTASDTTNTSTLPPPPPARPLGLFPRVEQDNT